MDIRILFYSLFRSPVQKSGMGPFFFCFYLSFLQAGLLTVIDLMLLGRSFHCLIAVKAKPSEKRDNSRDKWKLYVLPRVLYVWASDTALKFGNRYFGANLCRIRKRCAIRKYFTRSGICIQPKSRKCERSTCPRLSILHFFFYIRDSFYKLSLGVLEFSAIFSLKFS